MTCFVSIFFIFQTSILLGCGVESIARDILRDQSKRKHQAHVPYEEEKHLLFSIFELNNPLWNEYQWRAAIKRLLERGAKIDERFDHVLLDFTPLHKAARDGNLPLVKALIHYHASRYARTRLGWTPLYCAVLGNHFEVCEYLIKSQHKNWKKRLRKKLSGSLVHIPALDGETPRGLAERRGYKSIADLLELHNGKIVMSNDDGSMSE
ncbi:MAG: ankyrin repeat domain-containing protein [Bdellovibrionales bacterium]|nr:ankyrin repeat domain-containing protein [Bdellovibrionales bacterium]